MTTADAAVGRTPFPAYRKLRATHPVRVLRLLRNGVLLAIIATLLIWLTIAFEAHQKITAARRTQTAITNIDSASRAAGDASRALTTVFDPKSGDVALTGTGNSFAIDAAQVNSYVIAAAEGNAAGAEGSSRIQFVQGQLATCVQLAETAARVSADASVPESAANDASDCLTAPNQKDGVAAIPDTGGLSAALGDLENLQIGALKEQKSSLWLSPAVFWTLLLAPSAVLLVLVAASGYILAQHFRRYVSPLLVGALVITTGVAITLGAFSAMDDHRLSPNPWASHPITLILGTSLLAASAMLGHFAYRPRLAEYRFIAS